MNALLTSPAALRDEPLFELVDDRRVELPPMAMIAAEIASELGYHIRHHLEAHPGLGRMVNEGLFKLALDVSRQRRPDVAFLSAERLPLAESRKPSGDYPVPPEIAIEVLSPNDNAPDLFEKIDEYLRGGVLEVWVVSAMQKQVFAFASSKRIRMFEEQDSLDTPILPGFSLPLRKLFAVPA